MKELKRQTDATNGLEAADDDDDGSDGSGSQQEDEDKSLMQSEFAGDDFEDDEGGVAWDRVGAGG